ncbi:hypothetical protein FQN60_004759, partial [Etheostoma spectabile]
MSCIHFIGHSNGSPQPPQEFNASFLLDCNGVKGWTQWWALLQPRCVNLLLHIHRKRGCLSQKGSAPTAQKLSGVCAAMLILDVFSPLLLLSILLPRYGCRVAEIPEDTTSEFSVRLYHRLQAAGDQDNIIFSPLSVAVALGMVELGASGASLEEIRQAVGFSHLLPGVEFSLLQNLTAALSDDDTHYVIRFANSLFLQEGVTFNLEFLHLMRKYFRADVETVDFSESAAVAEQINSWVENHTESKIRELLSAEDFSSVTRLTLVNAVYFRGSWKNQFRPENTRTFSFSRDDGSEVQTLMMYQQGDFYYGEFSDGSQEAGGVYQVLEMPYEGEDMSMLIVLPRQEVPLASLEPIIKAPLLEEWANNVKRQKVEVYLPRFKVEQKIDLRSTLHELGIKNIFTNDADLSAMTVKLPPVLSQVTKVTGTEWADGKDLYIGKAVQKAYLEVTEEGAEGAVGSGNQQLSDRSHLQLRAHSGVSPPSQSTQDGNPSPGEYQLTNRGLH